MLRKIWYIVRLLRDRLMGVDFVGQRSCEIPGGVDYSETTPRIYRKLIRYMKNKSGVRLLDVGCGKGAMLKLFSKCNLERVDGLEYSEELCEIARANMQKLGLKSEVFQGDASLWQGYDEYNFFYLFNPLGKELMHGFVKNLESSQNRNNRELTVIYFNPKHKQEFLAAGWREEVFQGDPDISIFKFENGCVKVK